MIHLVLNSILFSVFTASLSVVLGILSFIAFSIVSESLRKMFILLSLLCLLLPGFLQAGAWYDFGLKYSIHVETLPFGAFVLSLQLWPLVVFLLLAMSKRLDFSLLEAARLTLPSTWTWTRILLPLLSPSIALGWMLSFILAINNFVVPTTFQTRIQITEVYVMFSSLYNTKAALLQSLPLLAVSLLGLVFIARLGKKAMQQTGSRHSNPDLLDRIEYLAPPIGKAIWLILFLFILSISIFPAFSRILLAISGKDVWTTIDLALPQFEASLAYALGSAIAASFLALGIWFLLRKKPRTISLFFESSLAVPFILSGFFLDILLIGLSQVFGKWAWWQGTWFLGITALTVRFVWIAYKAVELGRNQIREDVLDSAKVFSLPPKVVLRFIEWPAFKPSLLAACWLIYVLALWDVETLVMIYPPGGEPVSLKVYQLLHYGYIGQIGILSLALLGLGVLPGLLAIPFGLFKSMKSLTNPSAL
jgi:iron(III) transport system permease protein